MTFDRRANSEFSDFFIIWTVVGVVVVDAVAFRFRLLFFHSQASYVEVVSSTNCYHACIMLWGKKHKWKNTLW